MFPVADISFSACNKSVPNIVNESLAEVRISIDSSDMADDDIRQFFYCLWVFCVNVILKIPKRKKYKRFGNLVLLFLKEPAFMYTMATKDFSRSENVNCD